MDAFYTFLADDGWAIASHIALSTLMALFPFLIVLTSLAGFFGSKDLADQAASLMLQVWPMQVADAISGEVHDVLTTTRGDALTIGVVLAIYFASNGVESLRVALNRAYAVVEPRRWYWLRLESIGYTLIAAFTSLAMALFIVLGPLMLEAARRHIPLIVETNEHFVNVTRYSVTIAALVIALFILHAWLPAGRRSFLQILPGIIFTVIGSLVSGIVFGQYLARFANNYVSMYAGSCVGHHRAGVSVFHRRGFRLWRRVERGDHQVAAAARRVASSSAVASARGTTGLTRKASAPAARAAASSSPRPDTPMIAMRPSGGCKRADPPDRLDAVDAGQHHVHQHRVERAFRDAFRRGLAAPDEFRAMAEFGEDRVEHHAAERIVLDAENAQGLHFDPTDASASSPDMMVTGPLARARITVSVKVVPPPRRCLTTMSPPIARASCFTDDNPSPAPPKRCAIETLACENGRNRRLISASVRPMPLSETAKETPTLPFALRTGVTFSATLPLSVNFTALSTRFSSAARKRTGSPITKAGSFSEISTDDCRPLAAARPAKRISGVAGQRAQIEKVLPHAETGVAASRGIDEQGRKACEMFGAGLDGIDPAPLALVEIRGRQADR